MGCGPCCDIGGEAQDVCKCVSYIVQPFQGRVEWKKLSRGEWYKTKSREEDVYGWWKAMDRRGKRDKNSIIVCYSILSSL